MPRTILLHTHSWHDLPLQELAQRASEWSYQGLELACLGDHLEVQRAQTEDEYCQEKIDLLSGLELTIGLVSNWHVGQAIGDPITRYHQSILPDYVWGDGQAEGVRERAVEEMLATVRAAHKLGVSVVCTNTGSPIWSSVSGFSLLTPSEIESELETFLHHWQPIIELCRELGIQLAWEVQAGQIAFDIVSATRILELLDDAEEVGFVFNPASLFWQGVEPVEFLRSVSDRIYHVRIQDASIQLHGRSSLLCGQLPQGDIQRGWESRCVGHGGVDWEGVIRGINAIHYDGPLSIEWSDAGMDRDYGAEEALRFVQQLDFEPAQQHHDDQPFADA